MNWGRNNNNSPREREKNIFHWLTTYFGGSWKGKSKNKITTKTFLLEMTFQFFWTAFHWSAPINKRFFFAGECSRPFDAAFRIFDQTWSTGSSWTLSLATTSAIAMHITDHHGWLPERLTLHHLIDSILILMLHTLESSFASKWSPLRKSSSPTMRWTRMDRLVNTWAILFSLLF